MARSKAQENKPLTIMITREERETILAYGYPFEDIETQLRNAGDLDIIRVIDDPYWWEQVINNLHISAKENFTNKKLVTKLEDLIDRIADHMGLL